MQRVIMKMNDVQQQPQHKQLNIMYSTVSYSMCDGEASVFMSATN